MARLFCTFRHYFTLCSFMYAFYVKQGTCCHQVEMNHVKVLRPASSTLIGNTTLLCRLQDSGILRHQAHVLIVKIKLDFYNTRYLKTFISHGYVVSLQIIQKCADTNKIIVFYLLCRPSNGSCQCTSSPFCLPHKVTIHFVTVPPQSMITAKKILILLKTVLRAPGELNCPPLGQ